MNNDAISTINKKKVIVIALLGIAAIWLLITFIQFLTTGKLSITAIPQTPDHARVEVTVKSGQDVLATKDIEEGKTTSMRLGGGMVRVDSKSGNLRSLDVVKVNRLHTTKLTVPGGEDRQAQQLASDTKVCPLVIGGNTFSYSCGAEGQIVQHKSTSRGLSVNTLLFGGQRFSAMKPYQDGLFALIITDGNLSPLKYLNITKGTVQDVALTPDIRRTIMTNQQPTIVTPDEPGSTAFALVFNESNVIYVFDSLDDTQPVTIRPTAARFNETGRAASVNFTGGQLVVYLGQSPESTDDEGNDELPTTAPPMVNSLNSYIFEYSTDGKLTRTINLPADTTESSFKKLSDGYYVGEQPYRVTFYNYDDGKLKSIYSLEDAGDWISYGKNAYVQADSVLYEFKPGSQPGTFSLHGLFSNSNINVSNLYATTDGLLFTGVYKASGGSNNPSNLYKLLPAGEQGNISTATQTEPTYQGIDKLTQIGLTSTQIRNLKYAIGTFMASTSSTASTISISNVQVPPYDPTVAHISDELTFGLLLDDQPYKARLVYSNLTQVQLYVLNSVNSAQIYDSGPVNSDY